MSCFGAVATSSSSSGMRPGRRPWRWWRAKCAGVAAAVGSRLRRSVKARRRAPVSSPTSAVQDGYWCHRRQHRSFAPVYVDELYSHHQPAKTLRVVREEPTTSGGKPPAPDANRASGKATATARVAAAAATATGVGARASNGKAARSGGAAVGGVGAMRSILMRSPGRGGGVLGAVKGMGEVDLRAELFIRRFKEDMRLQSQRSAEEFQAMLARGL